jgi:hypothetical protein
MDEIADAYYGVISALRLTDFASQDRAAKIIFRLAAERRDIESDPLRDDAIVEFISESQTSGGPPVHDDTASVARPPHDREVNVESAEQTEGRASLRRREAPA